MSNQETLRSKVLEEMTKFEKNMEELHLLKSVTQDLKSYRKMIKMKKYD
jgi:hypothetical protein